MPNPAKPARSRSGSLSLRLTLSGALPIFVFALFSAASWWALQQVARGLERDILAYSKGALEAKDLAAHVIQVQQFLTDVSATRAQDGLDGGFEEAETHRKAFLANLQHLASDPLTAHLHAKKRLDSLRQAFDTYYAAGLAMARSYVEGGPAQGNTQMPQFDKASLALQDEVSPFVETHVQALSAAMADTARTVAWVQLGALVACGLAAAAVGLGTWRLVRSIQVPLGALMDGVQRIGNGDLATALPTRGPGEIGHLAQALERMREDLRATLEEVRQSAQTILNYSAEIAGGNQDLSERTERAAAELQITSAAMTQLTHEVQHNAQSAREAQDLAAQASQQAVHGEEVVQGVVRTMGGINDSSRRIADIIGVIDSLAFQTNILALNAAVEAARAGEQGRGFAVVAAEVRSLAGRSAGASREIRQLILNSVEGTRAGSQMVSAAGESMTQILRSVQQVSSLIERISSTAGQQTSGIIQMGSTVTRLDDVQQKNAALVEQSAAAAHELEGQARRLSDVVARFRLVAA